MKDLDAELKRSPRIEDPDDRFDASNIARFCALIEKAGGPGGVVHVAEPEFLEEARNSLRGVAWTFGAPGPEEFAEMEEGEVKVLRSAGFLSQDWAKEAEIFKVSDTWPTDNWSAVARMPRRPDVLLIFDPHESMWGQLWWAPFDVTDAPSCRASYSHSDQACSVEMKSPFQSLDVRFDLDD